MIYQSKVKNFNYKNWIIIWFCFKNTNIFKRLEKLAKKITQCCNLNFDIWKEIKSNRSAKKIAKRDLNVEQLKEMNKINSLFSDQIFKRFGVEQRSGSWYKSPTGYTITQFCNQTKDSKCQSNWMLRIKVPSGQAQIFFSKHCNHTRNSNNVVRQVISSC